MRRERLFIDLEQARFSLLLGSGLGDAGDLLKGFAGCAPPHDLKDAPASACITDRARR
jgi:hypothetical protein